MSCRQLFTLNYHCEQQRLVHLHTTQHTIVDKMRMPHHAIMQRCSADFTRHFIAHAQTVQINTSVPHKNLMK